MGLCTHVNSVFKYILIYCIALTALIKSAVTLDSKSPFILSKLYCCNNITTTEFKFHAKVEMAFSQMLAIRSWSKELQSAVSR